MSEKQILIVEDEPAISEMVAFALKRGGYQVAQATDCSQARILIANRRPDLMLVDWMLPDMSGLELTRGMKRNPETRDIPIIMLTARADETDKVSGLDGGADDYVTKPFAPRELLARISAVLRRYAPGGEDEVITANGLKIDLAGHRVSADGTDVQLGPTEYRMLSFFMGHPDRVYSRAQLLDRIWGGNVYVEDRTVDVHIRRLRKALEPHGCHTMIQTVRGAGYRFSGSVKHG